MLGTLEYGALCTTGDAFVRRTEVDTGRLAACQRADVAVLSAAPAADNSSAEVLLTIADGHVIHDGLTPPR